MAYFEADYKKGHCRLKLSTAFPSSFLVALSGIFCRAT
jgi:hypothetical protein